MVAPDCVQADAGVGVRTAARRRYRLPRLLDGCTRLCDDGAQRQGAEYRRWPFSVIPQAQITPSFGPLRRTGR